MRRRQPIPLPSWNDGAAKKSITDFVPRVTTEGGADFVPPDQRIATFDNDGTLWAEQPMYFQIVFAIDRVKALAAEASGVERRSSRSRPCSRTTEGAGGAGRDRVCCRSWRPPIPA